MPQPEGAVLATPAQVTAWDRFPVFMKLPVGTATTGVHRIRDRAKLAGLVSAAQAAGAFG